MQTFKSPDAPLVTASKSLAVGVTVEPRKQGVNLRPLTTIGSGQASRWLSGPAGVHASETARFTFSLKQVHSMRLDAPSNSRRS